jgi:hypothetical protein
MRPGSADLHRIIDLTCDADSSPGASQRFAYLAVASGFSAELLVDGDGFVLDYPPHWRLVRRISR